MKANDILLLLAVLGCIVGAGLLGYVIGGRRALAGPEVQRDTVVTVDTHFIDRPVEVVKWKDREKLVYIAVNDTALVTIHDTTFVAVEREIKRYSGEDYEAQVSGVQPQLDWVKVYGKTVTVTNTVKDTRRWTFGVTAGPGLVWNGSVHAGVGVVAGVQYRF